MADLRTTPRIQMTSGPVVMGEHVQPGGGGGAIEILWSVDGPLVMGSSNEYRFPRAGTITVFVAHLGTAGTTSTVLSMRKNGLHEFTITLPTGVEDVIVDPSISYDTADKWTCVITSPGNAAEDLQVQAYAA